MRKVIAVPHATELARPRRVLRAAALRTNELALLLLAGDAIAALLGVVVSPMAWARFDAEFAPRVDLRAFELVFVLTWLVLFRLTGSGDLIRPGFGRRTLASLGKTTLAAGAILLLVFYVAPFFAPRGSSVVTVPLVATITLCWRLLYVQFLRTQPLVRRAVIVGTDEAARRAALAIQASPERHGYQLIGFLSHDHAESDLVGAPVFGVTDDPWSAIAALDTDVLVVGHTMSAPHALLAELTRCFEHGVETVPATMLYEQLTGRVLAGALEADWYAELPTYSRGFYTIVKRVLDLVVAFVGSILLLPLMPFIGLAIVLDTGRPVLFRQVRLGLRGEPFVLHKFRTMRTDAEVDGQPRWAVPNDGRVTRVGRFLRATRIDELPQLWDVLRGKMSLVGPRPERPEFVDQLARELPLYRARTLVRPGITGWAQVQFPYASSVDENLAKLEYDLYYVRHLGLTLDVSIALRTVGVVLGFHGR